MVIVIGDSCGSQRQFEVVTLQRRECCLGMDNLSRNVTVLFKHFMFITPPVAKLMDILESARMKDSNYWSDFNETLHMLLLISTLKRYFI